MILRAISWLGSARSEERTASNVPSQSAFTMTGTSWNSPSCSSCFELCILFILPILDPNFSVYDSALLSDSTTCSSCPADGCDRNPTTSATDEGPTALTDWPRASLRTLTFPHSVPATTMSPTRRQPRVMTQEAMGPSALSFLDSMMMPSAGPSLGARKSIISARSMIASSSFSIPWPLSAEMLTVCTSPPNASTVTPCSMSCE
mmetsp:Transcript_29317/g.66436  ORF Transcript_29317/g.66436 Transcript_29317/m.66436 type:complete len:204 (+) Transcript_29317:533-1144(+)